MEKSHLMNHQLNSSNAKPENRGSIAEEKMYISLAKVSQVPVKIQFCVQNTDNIFNEELPPDCLMPTSTQNRAGGFPHKHPSQQNFHFCSIKQSWRRRKTKRNSFAFLKIAQGLYYLCVTFTLKLAIHD